MAKLSLLSILLCSVLFFNCSFGQQQQQQQQQQHGQQFQQRNECQIRSLNALEPTFRQEAEAGLTEFWDQYNQQFQCAGVAVIRHTIQSRGLLLPSYTNTPLLVYIEQGRGIQGIMLPGCPETFQSSQGSQQYEEGIRGERGESFRDRHQRIEHFSQGDVLAIQSGAAHWIYNDGNEDLVCVVLLDTSNNANQLDRNQRRFFLAGNPQAQEQQPGRYTRHRGEQQKEQYRSGNIFRGFSIETLAEAFGVDERTARRLQGEEDVRGHIVRVEQGLQVIRPPFGREGREGREEEGPYGQAANGLEETICSARVRQNIDNPARADIYNPRAGRFTSLNSFTLPILRFLRLSAEKGVLYRNSIFAPHWFINCHNIMYCTRGESRVQIADHRGQTVYDGQLREGQILIVPQNFAVVKQAGEKGFEWVGFNTNDNAMINTLSGRTSAIRGMPIDVIANSYQISREEARKMKFSRDQTLLFESRYRRERVASA